MRRNLSGLLSEHTHHASCSVLLRLDVRMAGSDEGRTLDTQSARQGLLQSLLDSALESDLARLQSRGPEGLVRRYLPPGTFSDLYHLYTAHQICHGAPAASSTTFYRTLASSGWKDVLRFRGKSQHTQCAVCHQLKSSIRHARGVNEHATACDKLYRHLGGQFADRAVYWEMRSRSRHEGDILTLICDGMDKSKFLVPRFYIGRTPKQLEGMTRPCCELYSVIIHGHCICTYITDADQTAGSNWVMEALARSLDIAFKQSQERAKPWPTMIRVYADNTPKDALAKVVIRCGCSPSYKITCALRR